jgi:hypothetical protein
MILYEDEDPTGELCETELFGWLVILVRAGLLDEDEARVVLGLGGGSGCGSTKSCGT